MKQDAKFSMHQEFETPESLRQIIKCFWYDQRDFGPDGSNLEVLPDGYAEIIFYFGNSCRILHQGEWKPLPSPFLMGLLNQPVLVHSKKRFEIIGIRCFPWTVLDVLALTSVNKGVHVFEHPIARLQPVLTTLVEAGKPGQAVTEIIRYFLDTTSRIAVDSLLYKAGAAMRAANGNIPVSHIADAAHATVRTLERRFKESSGHTLKDVSALMRFEQVRNQLWLNPDSNLAGLAHEAGYADQAHLSKEFKRFSGTTPSAFARKEKERKQLISDDFVAFIQD